MLTIALAQLNPIVGDIDGNADKARARARRGRAGGADLVLFPELFLAGYPPEDLVLKPAFQDACRAAVEALAARHRRRRPGRDRRHAVGRGRQALQRRRAARRRRASTALRYKVDLPNYGVFDEKRVFAPGPLPGPVELPRRAPRHADLRGHLGRGGRSSASPRPAPRSCSCPTARPIGRTSADAAPERGGGARRRDRPAAGLSQPGRRPGRTGVRRRLVRAQRRPHARRPDAGVRGGHRPHELGEGRRPAGAASAAPLAAPPAEDEANYARLRPGPARLRRQEPLPRRRARPLRRHRFRRCARRWRSTRWARSACIA